MAATTVVETETSHIKDDDAPGRGALVVLDRATTALTTITTLEEATQWHSELAAIEHYLKCHRAANEVQLKAALFKFRIQHRGGALLLAVPKMQGKRGEPDGLLSAIRRSGLSVWAAYRWMALAAMPESELIAAAQHCEESGDELTAALVYEVYLRRWKARHADSATTVMSDTPRQPTFAQAKQQLEELELLDPGALNGLSDIEAQTIVLELRKAYEYYCEDPVRGKVTSWGDEAPSAQRLQELWEQGPAAWQTERGWFAPYTVTPGTLSSLAREIIAEMRAGQGQGHRGVTRRLDIAGRLKASGAAKSAADPLLQMLAHIDEAARCELDRVGVGDYRAELISAVVRSAMRRLQNFEADCQRARKTLRD